MFLLLGRALPSSTSEPASPPLGGAKCCGPRSRLRYSRGLFTPFHALLQSDLISLKTFTVQERLFMEPTSIPPLHHGHRYKPTNCSTLCDRPLSSFTKFRNSSPPQAGLGEVREWHCPDEKKTETRTSSKQSGAFRVTLRRKTSTVSQGRPLLAEGGKTQPSEDKPCPTPKTVRSNAAMLLSARAPWSQRSAVCCRRRFKLVIHVCSGWIICFGSWSHILPNFWPR